MISAGARARRPASRRSAARARSRSAARTAARRARRELANTIVERCASTRSTMRSSTCGQIERASRGSPAAVPRRLGDGAAELGHVLDRDDDLEVDCLGGRRLRRSSTGARAPPRKRATSSTRAHGRRQADALGGPRRAARPAVRARARGARRAWCRRRRAPRRRSPSRRRAAPRGPAEVSSRKSDSGVVIRMSGGLRANAGARRPGCRRCGSPTRDLRQLGAEPRRRPAGCRSSGAAQVALDVDRERLERRDVEDAAAVERVLRRRAWWRAGRAPRGTPPASCPSRWGRRRARPGRRRLPARRPPGRRGGRERALEPRPRRAEKQPERRVARRRRRTGHAPHPRPPRRHRTPCLAEQFDLRVP